MSDSFRDGRLNAMLHRPDGGVLPSSLAARRSLANSERDIADQGDGGGENRAPLRSGIS
jgi:hypothetical protein